MAQRYGGKYSPQGPKGTPGQPLPAEAPLRVPGRWRTTVLFLSAFAFLVRAMVADVADEIRLETGKDRIGVLYSLITSTAKIGCQRAS